MCSSIGAMPASRTSGRPTEFEQHSCRLAMNEGSKAPDFFSGPIWAIFDRAAVERDKWNIEPPFTSPKNGFFFQADTIEELAAKIERGHEFQRVPLSQSQGHGGQVEFLCRQGRRSGLCAGQGCADVQDRHAAVLRGDGLSRVARFLRRTSHQRAGPGHRHAGRAHSAVSMPAASSSGGGNQHGLGRALVHGYIAGTNAAKELTATL